ncbi:SWIM zinc finger family protein [Telmatospirillum sp.]|uniref:SWIM zinc finger family protein n=1 Tax=Telmatospirillum sp. TaxID=2079197 RepID=UPI00284C1BDB|nr:SWIM zinc finger family protein [Telmatospirillum sp.]MDR3435057.1 SWIM zinc finger family protein [Telmatospirillum sp.]
MAYDYGYWPPYVSVAERRQQAKREVEKLRKKGLVPAPVTIEGRTIAKTFWGKAWCDNLEGYHDYENRLPRGRSYVRNGSVVDLQIEPLKVRALVSGSSVYKVAVDIKATTKPAWQSLCRDCAGSIDSLVELLQGRFSQPVMERLCRRDHGLFPKPSEIRFSCSCPDSASMCKHVAAVLYGVGWRLDKNAELLFLLRGVDAKDMVANLNPATPLSTASPASGKILETADISALFGLDMATEDEPAAAEPRPKKPRRSAAKPKPVKGVRSPKKPAAQGGKGKTVKSVRAVPKKPVRDPEADG